jgi:hypothetical protein
MRLYPTMPAIPRAVQGHHGEAGFTGAPVRAGVPWVSPRRCSDCFANHAGGPGRPRRCDCACHLPASSGGGVSVAVTCPAAGYLARDAAGTGRRQARVKRAALRCVLTCKHGRRSPG